MLRPVEVVSLLTMAMPLRASILEMDRWFDDVNDDNNGELFVFGGNSNDAG